MEKILIREVIKMAYQSAKEGNDPFAALLVKDNTIVASTIDYSVLKSDPTAHAELDLIRTYCSDNNLFSLEGYTLVSSTEPCIMCSGAIHWSRISKVLFSVSQEKLKKASKGNHKPNCSELINLGKNKVEVIGPILENEGFQVFLDFPLIPKEKRHNLLRNKK